MNELHRINAGPCLTRRAPVPRPEPLRNSTIVLSHPHPIAYQPSDKHPHGHDHDDHDNDQDSDDAMPPNDEHPDEPTIVRINFGKPLPLFPLHKPMLLPLEVAQVRLFEPRYLAMFEREVVDGAGLIAVATFEGDNWKQQYHGRPPLRPAVCIGTVVRHAKAPDGTYVIIMQGLCRAKIEFELPPEEGQLYRTAILSPLMEPDDFVTHEGHEGDDNDDEGDQDRDHHADHDDTADTNSPSPHQALADHRQRLARMLSTEPLSSLRDAHAFIEHLEQPGIRPALIIELLGDLVLSTEGSDRRYEFLAEPSAARRAEQVESSLERLAGVLRRAQAQRDVPTERGCNWN